MAHLPVLLQEVIDFLSPAAGEIWVDGTVGNGGHAVAMAACLGTTGWLVALDQDAASLARAKNNLAQAKCRVTLLERNFRQIEETVQSLGLVTVNGVFLDLGFSSDQLSAGRGLSFQTDEPLDMRLATDPLMTNFTAKDIVNDWTLDNLVLILEHYGEETFAKNIAAAIVAARIEQPIETTGQLVAIIKTAVPKWYTHRKLHFATKTFQALRIAVNDELSALKEGLAGAWNILAPGGRLGIISFHSLEARIVKNFIKEKKESGLASSVGPHVIHPSREEVLNNPRARSAQLRIISKI